MPKQVDHDAYRRELIDQCVELFAQRGYAALTMREIARALGVSTGTLYHSFPTKQAIFSEVARRAMETDEGFLEAVLAAGGPQERLAALVAHVAAGEERLVQQLLVLMEVVRLEGEGSPLLEQVHTMAREYVAGVVVLLGLPDPAVARSLLAQINGHLLAREIEGVAIDFDALRSQLTLLMTWRTS